MFNGQVRQPKMDLARKLTQYLLAYLYESTGGNGGEILN